MDKIHDTEAPVGEMPRFDDGTVNISELARVLAQTLVNEVMDAQADEACANGNARNGYRERRLVTCVGEMTLRIPKLRAGSFYPEDLLTRWSRTDRAVIAAVSEMVANGVSTRKAERVSAAMGIGSMSSSQVSRICESLDETIEDMQRHSLSGVGFPHISGSTPPT